MSQFTDCTTIPFSTHTKLQKWFQDSMQDCTLCPRKCHVNRLAGEVGYCGQSAAVLAARAALHFWEEPCISGRCGSGAVFLSGCNMRCVFCQNHTIALGQQGRAVSIERLSSIFLELQEQGANNINLVTPTHFAPQLALALEHSRKQGLTLPIVYNTSGYEEVEALRYLEGLIDIYLPDFKYFSSDLSTAYSHAPDYFEKAAAALAEMYRQVGSPVFAQRTPVQNAASKAGQENGTSTLYDVESTSSAEKQPVETEAQLLRGIIVRHLILPNQTKDSKKILRYLHETYGDTIYISIMNQYTPLSPVAAIPELNRRVSAEEYSRVVTFAERIGIEKGFLQEGETAEESFIPAFDETGIVLSDTSASDC